VSFFLTIVSFFVVGVAETKKGSLRKDHLL